MNLLAVKIVIACTTASTGGLICGDSLPQPNTTDSSSSILNTASLIAFSIIGGMAFLFLVIGGTRYTFSQGDPEKIQKAKNQIQYSLIGLIIVASAAAVVNFVVGKL